MDEGYVKYVAQRRDGMVPHSIQMDELNRGRTALFDLGLVGVYPNGIGYGNLSYRAVDNQFVITASATGALRTLRQDQFCLVESFSAECNRVQSMGSLPASSEAMTHGAIYAAQPLVHWVMHAHSRVLFDYLLRKHAPSTAADIPYGTPAMAHAVGALLAMQQPPLVFAMAGHDEGVVACGMDAASTLQALIALLQRTLKP